MPELCIVQTCKIPIGSCNLHKLPSNLEIRHVWLERANRLDLYIKLRGARIRHRMCDMHFDFYARNGYNHDKSHKLKTNALPTLLLPNFIGPSTMETCSYTVAFIPDGELGYTPDIPGDISQATKKKKRKIKNKKSEAENMPLESECDKEMNNIILPTDGNKSKEIEENSKSQPNKDTNAIESEHLTEIPREAENVNKNSQFIMYFKSMLAIKLKELEERQKILAENLINQILQKGSLQQLTSTHSIVVGSEKGPDDIEVKGNVLILKRKQNDWIMMKCDTEQPLTNR